jgi:hypothetical protein
MKKIPTIFERDWDGDRSRVLDQVHPGCEWVFAGEGVATRKIDGTSCMIRGGVLFKRREIKVGQPEPDEFQKIDRDNETGKVVGWVLVSETDPDDARHREGFTALGPEKRGGTYELIGPKVQGNPERAGHHMLIRHGEDIAGPLVSPFDRTFDGIKEFLENCNIEGIVFHHSDGRMAKIKGRDFGIRRPKP